MTGQIALSMAILCNALFIIQQGLSRARQPSGIDEANIFTLQNNWVGNWDILNKDPEALLARIRADLAMLRGLPGVIDAVVTNTFPLRGGGPGVQVSLKPNQREFVNGGAFYFADEHTINTLGIRLISGRNFTPEEIRVLTNDSGPDTAARASEPPTSPQIIVSRTLAQQIFPGESALGKTASQYHHRNRRSTSLPVEIRAREPTVRRELAAAAEFCTRRRLSDDRARAAGPAQDLDAGGPEEAA
jgi:putative ABC transport system permease protein